MKLKTLLLGSAASLMAVTSSFAADAVMAEPEAVEYVRVCDAYGAGYFYIPGTERCMQLSGEVRFEYRITDSDAGGDDDVDADWQYRARLAFRTANESDFGTIRTYIRLETSGNDPDGFGNVTIGDDFVVGDETLVGAAANRATFLQAMTLSIGGLEVGIFDNYWSKNNGYGDLFAMNDGYYGYDQALYAQYTYEIAGFAVTGGVEQTLNDDSIGGIPNFAGDELNLYVGANYGGSWGTAAATLYYDNFQDELDYRVSLDLKPVEGLRVKGWYNGGDGIYVQQSARTPDGDWAYGVSAAYTFGDVTPYLAYSDADDNDGTVVAGVAWSPASTDGLTVQLEGNFDIEDDNDDNDDRAYRLRLIKSF